MRNKLIKRKFLAVYLIAVFLSINFASIFVINNSQFNKSDKFTNDDLSSIINKPTSSSAMINDFTYYKVITIDNTKVSGSNNLTNFPLLISIFDSDLHDDVQSDGDDIASRIGDVLDRLLDLLGCFAKPHHDSTFCFDVDTVFVPVENRVANNPE